MLIEVAVNLAPGVIDRTLTFLVPPELLPRVHKGSLVLVEVNKQLCAGLVVDLIVDTDRTRLKAIKDVLEEKFLAPQLIELGRYLASRYFCPLSVALAALLPPATGRRLQRCWRWLPQGKKEVDAAFSLATCLPAPAAAIAAYLDSHGLVTEGQLRQFARRPVLTRTLALLQAHGLLKEEWHWRPAPRRRQQRWVVAKKVAASTVEALQKRAPRQATILEQLHKHGPQPAALLAADGGYAALRRLADRGLIEITEETLSEIEVTAPPVKLNRYQAKAVDRIKAALGRGGYFLLHGVTGSGKTEVYINCVREALAEGYQALVLVPEHSLIPQMVERLQHGLGVRVTVLHGNLPVGERSESWEQIRRGEVQVVTGSRSAVFAPLPHLGLIIIDEEHAGSYKQDAAPRYDTREVAIKRGQLEGAVVVMGSATPSIESYYLARQGRVQRLDLPHRVDNLGLPRTEIVDLRAEFRAGHQGILSRRLREEIAAALGAGRQAILFLNRRGYAPHVICRQCGNVVSCRHCAIVLTYHRDATLRCHYCGYVERAGANCSLCGGILSYLGTGTQRVEEEVAELWPGARIIRADRDTTAKRGQWETIYGAFAAGQADILIGTQTITKGMDFTGVTLVGVINADLSLYQPDFRARERTFQLITQVAGRAGRKTPGGRVIIQTYNPEDPAIVLAAAQDYYKFYAQELRNRQALGYPPFNKLVRLGFSGPEEAKVIEAAHNMSEEISRVSNKIEVMGPAPGYPSRLKDNYRWQLMLKIRGFKYEKAKLAEALRAFQPQGKVRLIVDVGPINPW
ncbi:MAG: primosomal protein N' [Clostridia bacterium]|nr:primosomal protein N' [Clostridia bacterium]